MALAPWVIQLFYTKEFLPAVVLLQWFIFGCLGRVISFPLSHVLLALGKGKLFLYVDSTFYIFHIVLIIGGLAIFGINGVAVAFAIMYLVYIFAVYAVCAKLINFRWSAGSLRMIIATATLFVIVFLSHQLLPFFYAIVWGLLLVAVGSVFSIRNLVSRLDPTHRMIIGALKIPGFRFVAGLKL
jgi:PST family polysaccharide transporter